MRLFRSPAFAAGNAATLLMFGALFSAVFFMAQFLQTTLGLSPLQAGAASDPMDRHGLHRLADRGRDGGARRASGR